MCNAANSFQASRIGRNLLKPLDADLNSHFQRLSIAFAKFEKEAKLALSRDAEVYAVKPSYESGDQSVAAIVDAAASMQCADPSGMYFLPHLSKICEAQADCRLRYRHTGQDPLLAVPQ